MSGTVQDVVLIKTQGQVITGWNEFSLTRGIERFPSSFQYGLTEKYPDSQDIIVRSGAPCVITVGNDTLLTGYVDNYVAELSATTNTVHIVGSSMCEDVLDCDAVFQDAQGNNVTQKTFSTVIDLASSLCDPLNIDVICNESVGKLILPQVIINLGEKIYEVIEQQARVQGLLVYDNPDGNLVLARAGTQVHAGTLQYGEGVQSATSRFDTRSRFTIYDVFYQAVDGFSDVMPNSNKRATATDDTFPPRADGSPRFRFKAIICEQAQLGNNIAQLRANFTANRMWGRSQALQVVVDRWRDEKGQLWTPNYLVNIALPGIKLPKQQWLISEVTYNLSTSNQTANLTLMPPQAFAVDTTPIKQFDADVLNGITPKQDSTPGDNGTNTVRLGDSQ